MNAPRRLMWKALVVLGMSGVALLRPTQQAAAAPLQECGICVPQTEGYHCSSDPDQYFQAACQSACGEPAGGTRIVCASVGSLWCNDLQSGYMPVNCASEDSR